MRLCKFGDGGASALTSRAEKLQFAEPELIEFNVLAKSIQKLRSGGAEVLLAKTHAKNVVNTQIEH